MYHARLGAAVLLIALPLAALAQTAATPPAAALAPLSPELKEARQKARAACSGDIERLCGTVQRGDGGLRGCMREHRAELSPECTSARSQLRALRRKEKG